MVVKRILLIVAILFGSGIVPAIAQTPGPGAPAYVAGTAFALIPAGQPSAVSVIQVGSPSTDGIPVVIRNETTVSVSRIGVLATVRDSAGMLLAAEVALIHPTIIPAGAIGFDVVPVVLAHPPADAVIALEAFPMERAEGTPDSPPVAIVSAEIAGNQIGGTARNDTNAPIRSALARALCFDAAGAADDLAMQPIVPPRDVPPGGEFAYGVVIAGQCDRFLVSLTVIG